LCHYEQRDIDEGVDEVAEIDEVDDINDVNKITIDEADETRLTNSRSAYILEPRPAIT